MSDTPRTDVAKFTIDDEFIGHREVVWANDYQKLEHELNIALKRNQELRGHLDSKRRCDYPEHAAALKAQKVAELKASGSLANNLCSDHRDKQNGQPCLACSMEKALKRAEEAELKNNRIYRACPRHQDRTWNFTATISRIPLVEVCPHCEQEAMKP